MKISHPHLIVATSLVTMSREEEREAEGDLNYLSIAFSITGVQRLGAWSN